MRGRLACNDFNFVRGAAIAGLGIAPLPAFGCRDDLRARELVRVLPQYSAEGGSLYAVHPSQRHLAPKVRSFVDFVSEHIAEWVAPPPF